MLGTTPSSAWKTAFGAALLAGLLVWAAPAEGQGPTGAASTRVVAAPPAMRASAVAPKASPPATPKSSPPSPSAAPSASASATAAAVEAQPEPAASAAAGQPELASAVPSVAVLAPVPSAMPAPSASGLPAPVAGFPVKLADHAVFAVRASHQGKGPEVRAREASEALKRAFEAESTSDVAVTRAVGLATLSVGKTPILELTEEDAVLSGESSLGVHAASAASSIRQTLVSERKRATIAKTAFSFSLVVFFGLIAFYLIQKLGEFSERARAFIDSRSDKELSVRFQNIEFVRPAMLRSSGILGLGTLKWLAQFGVAYTWLVLALSLFEATRGYTQKLTGFVVAPLSQLMARLATALPLLVVAALAALAVFVLVRFIGLFFVSVARGETPLAWLPSDLAGPTSVLLRVALVLAALVFLAPVVTGDNDGVLGRMGAIALIALGLSTTPLLASAALGAVTLYGRRLRAGEYVEFGAYRGRIAELNLLELRLTLSDKTELRVPHLLTLVRPLRLLGARPRLTLDVYVSSESSVTEVRSLLAAVAGKVGSEPSVEIVSADTDAIRFRIAALCETLDARTAFQIATLDALAKAGVALGRERA